MFRIGRNPTAVLMFLPLFFLTVVTLACGALVVENQATSAPPPPAATPTTSPTATPVPTPTQTPNVPLPVVPAETVELSVLIEPLDVGYVEVVGSKRMSNGQATEVHRNDQINLIARPVDPEKWRFDR